MDQPSTAAMIMKPRPAILLVGPTGAGKSPVGDYMERKIHGSSRIFHFDFGALLRRLDSNGPGLFDITAKEINIVRQSLATGALLENDDFLIAVKILLGFAGEKQMEPSDLILLNGLPRHTAQALTIEPYAEIKQVWSLVCTPAVIKERIKRNSGGDRTHRTDDDDAAIENKLDIFHKQTMPLLDHYLKKRVPVLSLAVAIETTPEQIYRKVLKENLAP